MLSRKGSGSRIQDGRRWSSKVEGDRGNKTLELCRCSTISLIIVKPCIPSIDDVIPKTLPTRPPPHRRWGKCQSDDAHQRLTLTPTRQPPLTKPRRSLLVRNKAGAMVAQAQEPKPEKSDDQKHNQITVPAFSVGSNSVRLQPSQLFAQNSALGTEFCSCLFAIQTF
ncbi:hypothetical protein G7046_g830 [Stylonectria norvegica]|nr:hypothetical protein G7046_g830 [Stylonectria norvegica]